MPKVKVASGDILMKRVPLTDRNTADRKGEPLFAVMSVDLPEDRFPDGCWVQVNGNLQTSNENRQDNAQLHAMGLFAARKVKIGKGYKRRKKLKTIIGTDGYNVTRKMHHGPLKACETFQVKDGFRTVFMGVNGNVRAEAAPDGEMIIEGGKVSATLINVPG